MNDGGPLFPSGQCGPDRDGNLHPLFTGASLRDWFAGQALAGLLANQAYFGLVCDEYEPGEGSAEKVYEHFAIASLGHATAMLAERAKQS